MAATERYGHPISCPVVAISIPVLLFCPVWWAWRAGNHSGAPGGTAGFCFDLRSRCAFMVPPKINTTRFSAPPQKAALGLASRDPLAFGRPARRGRKGETQNE